MRRDKSFHSFFTHGRSNETHIPRASDNSDSWFGVMKQKRLDMVESPYI